MRARMKQYVARLCKGTPLVYVIQADGDTRFLRRHPELCEYGSVHRWGCLGAGSLQLAFDLLYDATQDAFTAGCLHEAFQRRYIAKSSPRHEWRMSEAAVHKAAVILSEQQA